MKNKSVWKYSLSSRQREFERMKASVLLQLGIMALVYGFVIYSWLSDPSLRGRCLTGIFLSVGIIAFVAAMAGIVYHRVDRPTLVFRRRLERIKNGEAAAVLTEVQQQGDHSPRAAILSSGACCQLGRGAEAESYAHEALDTLQQQGVTKNEDWDLAALALYDALVMQGQFSEAAAFLRSFIPDSRQPNFLTALVVWALYLNREYDGARSMLAHIQLNQDSKSKGRAHKASLDVSPKYRLMLAYVRHQLGIGDTSTALLMLRSSLPEWDAEMSRHAHDPYGVRLGEILSDLRQLPGMGEIEAANSRFSESDPVEKRISTYL